MKIFTAVFILTAFVAPLEAQWLERRTPGIPRTADGKPNLTAPAPRTADGKPELTGLWQMISPDGAIGNVSLRKPGDLQPADIQPWAQDLVRQRAENFGVENPRYKCLRRSELQHRRRSEANPSDSCDARHPARRSHLPPDPHGRPRLGDGSQPDLDGVFGRPLGRRHSGSGEQRIQRPDMAPWRLSAYRSVAHDGALPAHRFRPPGNSRDVR